MDDPLKKDESPEGVFGNDSDDIQRRRLEDECAFSDEERRKFSPGDPRRRKLLPDHIEDSAYAGIPGSPQVVSKAKSTRYLGPKKLSHRLKYIVELAAMGLSGKEIAERTGYSFVRISIILNTAQISNEVERARRFMFGQDAERALKSMLPKALGAIEDVLLHETTEFRDKRDKASTAFTLLERTHGKPKQSIEVGGNLLADLYALMDQKTKIVDVEYSKEAQEAQYREIKKHRGGGEATEDSTGSTGSPDVPNAPPVPAQDLMDEFLDKNLGKAEKA